MYAFFIGKWSAVVEPNSKAYVEEINRAAIQCLARELVVIENKLYIVEDESSRRKEADAYGAVLVGDEMVGPSLLGRFLMELRDTGKLDYTLPADALNFIEHLKE